MGYTHYWYVDRAADPDAVVRAGREMAKLVEAEREILAGWNGEGEPEIDLDGSVRFNGKGPDLDHETFAWPPDLTDAQSWRGSDDGKTFTFCKTARKPYDKVVVACLLVALRELGDAIEISSDAADVAEFMGSEMSGGWQQVNGMLGHPTEPYDGETAGQLYARVFGEAPPIPPCYTLQPEEAELL